MPIHDWTQVEAGIFHAFHHDWITEIARALNRSVLPPDHYALPEQHAVGFGPDVLTLQQIGGSAETTDPGSEGGGVMLAPPKLQPIAETDMAFYRRKQKTVTVRHVSGDRIVAIIEIVSPGNKAARNPLRAFVAKAAELLDQQIHLLISICCHRAGVIPMVSTARFGRRSPARNMPHRPTSPSLWHPTKAASASGRT